MKAATDAAFLFSTKNILLIISKKYMIDVMHFHAHRLNLKWKKQE